MAGISGSQLPLMFGILAGSLMVILCVIAIYQAHRKRAFELAMLNAQQLQIGSPAPFSDIYQEQLALQQDEEGGGPPATVTTMSRMKAAMSPRRIVLNRNKDKAFPSQDYDNLDGEVIGTLEDEIKPPNNDNSDVEEGIYNVTNTDLVKKNSDNSFVGVDEYHSDHEGSLNYEHTLRKSAVRFDPTIVDPDFTREDPQVWEKDFTPPRNDAPSQSVNPMRPSPGHIIKPHDSSIEGGAGVAYDTRSGTIYRSDSGGGVLSQLSNEGELTEVSDINELQPTEEVTTRGGLAEVSDLNDIRAEDDGGPIVDQEVLSQLARVDDFSKVPDKPPPLESHSLPVLDSYEASDVFNTQEVAGGNNHQDAAAVFEGASAL